MLKPPYKVRFETLSFVKINSINKQADENSKNILKQQMQPKSSACKVVTQTWIQQLPKARALNSIRAKHFFNFRRFLGSRCCSLFSRRIFLILVHKDDKFFCTCSQGAKSCSWKSIVLLKSAEENMLHLRWSSTHWRKEKLQQSFRMHTPPSACFACFRRGVHPSALLQFLFSSVCSCPTFECSNFSSFLFSKKVTFYRRCSVAKARATLTRLAKKHTTTSIAKKQCYITR